MVFCVERGILLTRSWGLDNEVEFGPTVELRSSVDAFVVPGKSVQIFPSDG